MFVNISKELPAYKILSEEGIKFFDSSENNHIKIAIFNIMPEKAKTETHLLRALSYAKKTISVDFFAPETHKSKTVSQEYLDKFYTTFSLIKNNKYDGLIITGAPVELMDFEKVTYWNELKNIMNWADENVKSTLYICWAAQAGLYHFYGIPKYELNEKKSGVFNHKLIDDSFKLSQNFDTNFYAPHSRYTDVKKEDIEKASQIRIIGYSDEAGVYIVADKNKNKFFITGHPEYDADTLKQEYLRDLKKGINIKEPENYFIKDGENLNPIYKWNYHARMLYFNWVNYFCC